MTWISFRHPEPVKPRHRLVPVFLPYHGCSEHCIYCSQHIQTGAGRPSLSKVYQTLQGNLKKRVMRKEQGLGLAFFGGTFTALSMRWQKKFLNLAQHYREHGLLTHVRCSTRPDRIAHDHLAWLEAQGMDMVELGIQSFNPDVLIRSKRGYSDQTAIDACLMIKQSGLQLGVQLMPGLPGATWQSWRQDVEQTCVAQPQAVRIYPCLALRNTLLATAYHRRKFRPWGLKRTVWEVGQALLAFWQAGILVIRIGLAYEHKLVSNITAGPWHHALGQMSRSLALYLHVIKAMASLPSPDSADVKQRAVFLPKRYAGEFWGHRRELANAWERLGIRGDRVHAWEHPHILVVQDDEGFMDPSKMVAVCSTAGQKHPCKAEQI